MNPKSMNRREVCKNLLTVGSLAFGGAALARGGEPAALTEVDADEIAVAIQRGATMEEIAKLRHPVATSPALALRELKAGNARFFGASARRQEISAVERRAQTLGQTPFAVILGCSDSRVPTEIIFDQSLGNLFITRIAGNVVDNGTTASIEYAVNHLKTLLIVVMGHEGCGAVKAALLPADARAKETESIQALLNQITPALENIPKLRDEKAKMREAVIANVRYQVANINKKPAIRQAVEDQKVLVVGAFYEISSGAVDFLETEEDLRLSSAIPSAGKCRGHLV